MVWSTKIRPVGSPVLTLPDATLPPTWPDDLLRARSFTRDDAPIFCTEDPLTAECIKVNDLIVSIYEDFGFSDIRIKLSTRPERRIGSDASWNRSEQSLRHALDALGRPYTIDEGEGAFSINADGEKIAPVMLYRAMFGSLERFTGILVEHYAGRFRLWLAPVQAVIATVTPEADDCVREVAAQLRARGLRVKLDLRSEKIL